MKRKLFGLLALMGGLSVGFAQDACNYGTVSDATGQAENIATGGVAEYAGAADFTVPYGTTFTANRITLNILKGPASLGFVNVAFLTEVEGLPTEVIQEFNNMTPSSQVLAYEIEQNFASYVVTIDLPETVEFEKGKYFLRVSASPGDTNGAWWEITDQVQTYGAFDFFQFEEEPWGGAGYYNKVFSVIGTCAPSGEEQPDYGDACQQGNTSPVHETGVGLISEGAVQTVADDFIVPENTTFHMTHFTMSGLLLGGGIHNATITIRTSENGAPGQILHTFVNKGPNYEQYNGYWAFPGQPLDVVSVIMDFSFEYEPIELPAGTYFIDVTATPNSSEFLTWEATSEPGIGGSSYISNDGGTIWTPIDGYNQIFSVSGFCSEDLGTGNPVKNAIGAYPNPVKSVLNFTSDAPLQQVVIFDIEGRQVARIENPGLSVNLSGLANGLYVARITSETGSVSNLKIVKE